MTKHRRFTDSEKWSNKWFRNLSSEQKLFWIYVHDKCDQSGVWKEDFEEVKFYTGIDFEPEVLVKTFKDEVIYFPEKKIWWIKNYCTLQYNTFLTEEEVSPPRKYAVKLLKERGLYKNYVEHYKSSLSGIESR